MLCSICETLVACGVKGAKTHFHNVPAVSQKCRGWLCQGLNGFVIACAVFSWLRALRISNGALCVIMTIKNWQQLNKQNCLQGTHNILHCFESEILLNIRLKLIT